MPTHIYTATGYYIANFYLVYGGSVLDSSISNLINFHECHYFPIGAYNDALSGCTYDSASIQLYSTTQVQVSTSGTPVDTINIWDLNYYDYSGAPGTVYSFSVITPPVGFALSCPAGGILYDTVPSPTVLPIRPKYFGFSCVASSGFDLAVNPALLRSRVYTEKGDIYVNNNYCTGTDAIVTLKFSPKYSVYDTSGYFWIYPTPYSVSDSTIVWVLPYLSADSIEQVNCSYRLYYNSTTGPLVIGDTVRSIYTVGPITGDVNTVNNYATILDTVRAGWDPNVMSVYPAGYITSGTTLQYTIGFQNDGNDTAYNIHILDMLPDGVVPSSLNVLSAPAYMITNQLTGGGGNWVDFSFPNIKLPDSAHHGQCDGAVIFTVRTQTGLTAGTVLLNSAGIYFDNNPVVYTDTVTDIIGTPAETPHIALHNSGVLIYPNPVNNTLTIKARAGAYSALTITNSIGQVMSQQPITATQTQINTSLFAAGLYYILLTGDSAPVVEKFVKE